MLWLLMLACPMDQAPAPPVAPCGRYAEWGFQAPAGLSPIRCEDDKGRGRMTFDGTGDAEALCSLLGGWAIRNGGKLVDSRDFHGDDGTVILTRVWQRGDTDITASCMPWAQGVSATLQLAPTRFPVPEPIEEKPAPVPISLDQAMTGAAEGTDRGWKLVSISNTGRFGELAYANWRKPTDPMTRSDGLAGQWVVEYFKPKSVKSDGAVCYPARRVLVMSDGPDALGDGSVCPASALVELPRGTASHFDAARKLAATTLGMPFDAVAVSTPDVDGTPVWRFQFYGNSVGDASVVVVSIDGRTVIPRESVGL